MFDVLQMQSSRNQKVAIWIAEGNSSFSKNKAMIPSFGKPNDFFVCRKPLARLVVRKKASAVDDDKKTPFAILSCGLTTATKQKEVIRQWTTQTV